MGRIGLGLTIAALPLGLALAGGARAGVQGNWLGIDAPHPAWVRFTDRGMLFAQAGCVLFNGKYTVHGDRLSHPGAPLETENGCSAAELKDAATMAYWRRTLQTLKTADGFEITGDRLTLSSPDHGELVLVRKPEPHIVRPASIVSDLTHRREHAGQCFSTRVKQVEFRLRSGEDGPWAKDSGSAIEMTDGHYMVDYGVVKAMDRSRKGDPIRMCVRTLPAACPPGDTRGIVYRARNLRTGLHWTEPDSEHSCGGA